MVLGFAQNHMNNTLLFFIRQVNPDFELLDLRKELTTSTKNEYNNFTIKNIFLTGNRLCHFHHTKEVREYSNTRLF